MKIDELIPFPTEKVQFKLSSFKLVPHLDGCYILTTFDNDILYIGLATDLNNRFKQHLENPEKTSPTIEGKAIWFYYQSFDPKTKILTFYTGKLGKMTSNNLISKEIFLFVRFIWICHKKILQFSLQFLGNVSLLWE